MAGFFGSLFGGKASQPAEAVPAEEPAGEKNAKEEAVKHYTAELAKKIFREHDPKQSSMSVTESDARRYAEALVKDPAYKVNGKSFKDLNAYDIAVEAGALEKQRGEYEKNSARSAPSVTPSPGKPTPSTPSVSPSVTPPAAVTTPTARSTPAPAATPVAAAGRTAPSRQPAGGNTQSRPSSRQRVLVEPPKTAKEYEGKLSTTAGVVTATTNLVRNDARSGGHTPEQKKIFNDNLATSNQVLSGMLKDESAVSKMTPEHRTQLARLAYHLNEISTERGIEVPENVKNLAREADPKSGVASSLLVKPDGKARAGGRVYVLGGKGDIPQFVGTVNEKGEIIGKDGAKVDNVPEGAVVRTQVSSGDGKAIIGTKVTLDKTGTLVSASPPPTPGAPGAGRGAALG